MYHYYTYACILFLSFNLLHFTTLNQFNKLLQEHGLGIMNR